MDDLLILADLEKDPSLITAVEGLEDAWINRDEDGFEIHLHLVVFDFERLFLRDCL